MCRHEAAEALGALGDRESLAVLRSMRDDTKEEGVVRETCEIAIGRIEWEHSGVQEGERLRARFVNFQKLDAQENSVHLHSEDRYWLFFCRRLLMLRVSDFASIDPAPPISQASRQYSIIELQEKLLDTYLPLFERYRAMFALRDLSSPPDLPTAVPAVKALALGFTDSSALFRHEIAFVFGQLSHPASIPSLIATLSNAKEESMVRHEAAEALGSLGDEEGVEDVLKCFLDDPEQVVRDSVIVALDMAEFEKNGEKEYATLDDVKDFSPFVKMTP